MRGLGNGTEPAGPQHASAGHSAVDRSAGYDHRTADHHYDQSSRRDAKHTSGTEHANRPGTTGWVSDAGNRSDSGRSTARDRSARNGDTACWICDTTRTTESKRSGEPEYDESQQHQSERNQSQRNESELNEPELNHAEFDYARHESESKSERDATTAEYQSDAAAKHDAGDESASQSTEQQPTFESE